MHTVEDIRYDESFVSAIGDAEHIDYTARFRGEEQAVCTWE